jgi:putative phosphoesterase
MKIGVVSDTHKHLKNFEMAVRQMKKLGVEMIVHLGDDYADPDDIGENDIVRVPGVYSDQYQDPGIANRRVMDLAGWQVLLSHTREAHPNDCVDDLKPEALIQCKQVNAVLYGHTHIPDASKESGVVFVNPGHLKDDDKKGNPPTFAVVEFDEHDVTVEIYRLTDNSPLMKEQFRR